MICPKCGTENAAGDAFCGGCGAYLEFAAEEAAEAGGGEADAGAVATAGPGQAGTPSAEPLELTGAPEQAPRAAGAGPGVVATSTGSVATTAPAAGTPASPGTPVSPEHAAGPTCTACGRVNPTGRRFCISCGELLPVSSRAGGATPESAPGKPAWDFPMPTIPPPAATTAPTPAALPAKPGHGGRSRLLVGAGAVVAIGVLVVVGAAFLAGGGLGGGTATASQSAPPSGGDASGAPTAAATPGGSPGASEAPSEAPTAEATPGPTIPPGPTVGVRITGAKASSQLASAAAPKYLFDGSPVTAWRSAAAKFENSWIEVTFAPAAITEIWVQSGFQKDDPNLLGNHRPHNVTISFDGAIPVPVELQDVRTTKPTRTWLKVPIPPELGIVRATKIRVTMIDVYPAKKTSAKGTPTKSVAISELRLYGVPVTP